MHLLSGIILGIFLGVASCDMECFEQSTTVCQLEWFFKHGASDHTFCKMHPEMAKCASDAAQKCKTGFENEAEKARLDVTDLCTEGTKYNDALKHDKVCDITTLEGSNECTTGLNEDMNKPGKVDLSYPERMRILCRWTDKIKECMYKKFQDCTDATNEAFRAVYETTGVLQKKICEALKVNEKRNVEKSPYSPLFLPMF